MKTLMLLKSKIQSKLAIIIYTVLALTLVVTYIPAIINIKNQDAWLYVIESNVTINFLLLFYLYGCFADYFCKKRGWSYNDKKSWLVWGIGIIILLVIFRNIGGMETIFG